MGKVFQEETDVLFDENDLMGDFHLFESGFEECMPTKPYVLVPIDYWVIHYCSRGKGSFQLKDRDNEIGAGDIFMIPPHTVNKYYPDREDPWCYRWIGLRGNKVKEILGKCGLSKESCVLHGKPDPKTEELFAQVYEKMKDGHRLGALGCVFELLELLEKRTAGGKDGEHGPGEMYFQKLLVYIGKNYGENISVTDMAKANHIDRTYVYKLFLKYAGMSPSRYLQQYRLDKACALLRKSSLNITDISYAAGFQQLPYFTKLFKEYTGSSPSEYRKQFLQFGKE